MTDRTDTPQSQPEIYVQVSDWQRGYSAGFAHKALAMLIVGAYLGAIGTWLVIGSGLAS